MAVWILSNLLLLQIMSQRINFHVCYFTYDQVCLQDQFPSMKLVGQKAQDL